jgi:hypothetical protein
MPAGRASGHHCSCPACRYGYVPTSGPSARFRLIAASRTGPGAGHLRFVAASCPVPYGIAYRLGVLRRLLPIWEHASADAPRDIAAHALHAVHHIAHLTGRLQCQNMPALDAPPDNPAHALRTVQHIAHVLDIQLAAAA